MKRKKQKNNLIIKIGRKIRIRYLVLLIMLLITNSYAWFIFSTKVGMSLTAHVATWSINFTSGTGETVTYMTLHVDRIFPGMEEASELLNITNSGTESADLNYEILSFRIFNDEYEQDNTYTSEDLEDMLKNDYPFKFDFIRSTEVIPSLTGAATFEITLNWPYESNDDAADTDYGEQAYTYYATNPTEPAIEVILEVQAIQQPPSGP